MNSIPVTIGLDEVGRGALAGPLVVGLVSLDGIDKHKLGVKLESLLQRPMADSKKLYPQQREKAAHFLREKVIWSLGEASAQEIDEFGLTKAVRLAAGRAMDGLSGLGYEVSKVWADAGLFHPFENAIPTKRVIRGDEQIAEIMYASVLAKVYRDQLMAKLGQIFPEYRWEKNAGYGTEEHRRQIITRGITPHHRQLFLHTLQIKPAG